MELPIADDVTYTGKSMLKEPVKREIIPTNKIFVD